jgi:hypothetical protein
MYIFSSDLNMARKKIYIYVRKAQITTQPSVKNMCISPRVLPTNFFADIVYYTTRLT